MSRTLSTTPCISTDSAPLSESSSERCSMLEPSSTLRECSSELVLISISETPATPESTRSGAVVVTVYSMSTAAESRMRPSVAFRTESCASRACTAAVMPDSIASPITLWAKADSEVKAKRSPASSAAKSLAVIRPPMESLPASVRQESTLTSAVQSSISATLLPCGGGRAPSSSVCSLPLAARRTAFISFQMSSMMLGLSSLSCACRRAKLGDRPEKRGEISLKHMRQRIIRLHCFNAPYGRFPKGKRGSYPQFQQSFPHGKEKVIHIFHMVIHFFKL